jgi:enterochelin esterase family protein
VRFWFGFQAHDETGSPSARATDNVNDLILDMASEGDMRQRLWVLGGMIFCLFLQHPVARSGEEDLGPDSQRQEGVPRGTVTEKDFTSTKVYPGTYRKYWLYVPAQYKPDKPACVMIFQDGFQYVMDMGARVPIVFDNLIHKKVMPVTIAILVNPGVYPAGPDRPKQESNRSVEYDTLSDQYARFILEEILPEVAKDYNLTADPQGRAICGLSSGGICSFTAAWERPDAFAKVVSHIGSFTNIRGGHVYPALIRKTPQKPIRVFLQDGSNDLDNSHGNWPLANQEMAAALKFAGYDYQFVYGSGAHNIKHGAAILPDTLRWLWRDYPKE